MVSLYARVLHCLLLISGEKSLQSYAKNVNTWSEPKGHATEILRRFANADLVQELREPRSLAERKAEADVKARKKSKQLNSSASISGGAEDMPNTTSLPAEAQGDTVFENACLFLRDALLTRLFADAVKAGDSGDSGLVILVLKHWVFGYPGNGRTKYAHAMLHLFHNLVNVCTQGIRKAVTQNWLLNPTGKANAFVEIDLVQEHLNFGIKRVYNAEGGSHSWDWLALVSPAVNILRKLSTKINNELGAKQGSKHKIPDLQKDIAILMAILKEHAFYTIEYGHVVDVRDRAVPDVIANSMNSLNTCENGENLPPSSTRKLSPAGEDDQMPLVLSEPSTESQASNVGTNSPAEEEEDSEESNSADASQDDLDPDLLLESQLIASPTLERLDEDDVALDMDDWVLDGESDEDITDDSEEEEGEEGEVDVD
ncbi:hypothetical protein CVT26_007521 [Gymnopilus dilepis]|uniref:DUF6589 domain-containing protein n=1 Tax=Gymnopilus dilepis TaxID=231916 RepID=A0A409X2K7_9AGAR|nr:hypothetical protein CVT26_007521 [Gymnopilus dilepis]